MIWPEYIPQWYVWVIAAFLPYVEQFIIGKSWKSVYKVLSAVGISVLVSLGAVYLGGKFDLEHILVTLGVVFTLAQTMYDAFWKDILS